MADAVLCPYCGSAATLPLPGLGEKVSAVFSLAFAHRGQDLSFNNAELARKFAAGQIDALCKTCRKRFHSRTRLETAEAAAGPVPGAGPSAPARPPAERLRELERLRAEGLLTDDEYRAKRAEILRSL
ncbi:MAG: SHOCT domain-containing protein [Anaerolineales bacterium]|nr:SHOCT domain-containing protein [Anaerolineales bacterium]